MKYLKTYEGLLDIFKRKKKKLNFNVDDYIVYDEEGESYYAKIGEWKYLDQFDALDSEYYVVFSDGKVDFIDEDQILRLMLPEEIEQFEIEKNAKKYNL